MACDCCERSIFPEGWEMERILRHGLSEILENQRIIMADISKLQGTMAELAANVAALIAKPTVPSQAEIDALEASAAATNDSVKVALAQP